MKHWLLIVFTALAPLLAAPPQRVVSHSVGTDDLLLAIANPTQIAALSALGRDQRYSPHWRDAQKFPALKKGEAEDILRYKPDLVILPSYSPVEVRTLLQRAKVNVFLIERYSNIEEIFATALKLGKVLGREDHAKGLVKQWRSRVDALQARLKGVKPVRVMAAGLYPFAAGSQTTFQDICDHAGAINVAAEAGLVGHVPMPGEKPLGWKIDMLVGPKEDGRDLTAKLREISPYKFMSVLKKGKLIQIDAAFLAATSHRRIDAFEALAKALHPERFK